MVHQTAASKFATVLALWRCLEAQEAIMANSLVASIATSFLKNALGEFVEMVPLPSRFDPSFIVIHPA